MNEAYFAGYPAYKMQSYDMKDGKMFAVLYKAGKPIARTNRRMTGEEAFFKMLELIKRMENKQ